MSNPLPVPSGGPSLLAQAQAHLASSLAALPPDRTGAVVVVATTEGAKAAVVARVGDDWQVEGWVQKEWKGGVDYGATVLWTFR